MFFKFYRNQYIATLRLATPIIAAHLAQMALEIVDTIMIGRLGKQELASAALSGITYISILIFFIGLLSSVGVFVARHLGAKEHKEIASVLFHGFLIAALSSIPVLTIIFYLPNLLIYIGQDPSVVSYCQDYLHAVMLGAPAFLIFVVFREFLSALMFPGIIMILSIIAIPLNALLNYLLMYGTLGFPAYGIAGAGYATSIINWLMPISLIIYLYNKKNLKNYLLDSFKIKLNISLLKSYLKLGSPVGLNMSFEVGLFAVIAIFMGYFGTDSLAAHQVAAQTTSVAFMFMLGLSQATAVRLSHAIGAKEFNNIKPITFSAIQIGLMICTVSAFIFIFLPEYIASLFFDVNDKALEKVLTLTSNFLFICGLFQFPDVVQVILNGSLRGLKDTFTPMIIAVCAYWIIGVSFGVYFAFYLQFKGAGLWLGLTLGLIASCIMLLIRFNHKSKQFI